MHDRLETCRRLADAYDRDAVVCKSWTELSQFILSLRGVDPEGFSEPEVTQRQVCEQADICNSTLCNLERDPRKTRIVPFYKLLDAMGLEMNIMILPKGKQ